MVSGDTISEFHLLGNVTVTGTDLNLTSDELHITAVKKGDKDATVTAMGKIMNIIAIGSVKIIQEGRTAEAGRADIYPEEKKVVLTINPVVTDAQGTISGDEIEWFAGQRRAQVRGNTVVTLSVLPDLGYDADAEPDPEEEEAIEESEPSGEGIEEAPPTP
jgi:lipopolysaccharide transport protein LptA